MNAANQAYNLVLPEKKAAYHLEEVRKLLREVNNIPSSSDSLEDKKTSLLQEAVSHIRKGITLAPRDVIYYIAAADVYEALLDNSSACSHLRYAINVIGVDSSEHPFGFEKDLKDRLADLLFRRARGWLECGNSAMAIEVLSEATNLKPREPKAWLLMAMARLKLLDHPTYQDKSNSSSRKEENESIGKSTSKKNTDLSNDQLSLVLTCLDKALEFGKECQAFILRGKVNWAIGQSEAGNRDFRAAASLDPGHPEVLIFQNIMFSEAGNLYSDAKRYVSENDLESAVKSLTLAIKAAPEDVRLVVMRASILRRMGCLEDAFVDLDRAARMYFVARYDYKDPDKNASLEEKAESLKVCMSGYPECLREPFEVTRQRNLTYNEAALELMVANDHQSALEILNKTIESEMALAVANDNAKHSAMSKKHNFKLKTANQQALEEIEDSAGKGLGKERDETIHSISHIKKSTDLTSYGVDVRFLINRGDCHRALGNLKNALYDFNSCLEIDPGNWELKTRLSLVYYQYGVDYFNQNKYNESIKFLSKAIEFNQRVALYFAARGETFYQAHLFSGAYDDFKKALQLDPNLTHILDRYRQLEPSMKTLKVVALKRDASLPFGNIMGSGGGGGGLMISNGRNRDYGGNNQFSFNGKSADQNTKSEESSSFNNGQDKILYVSTRDFEKDVATGHKHLITFPMVSPSKQNQNKKRNRNRKSRELRRDQQTGSKVNQHPTSSGVVSPSYHQGPASTRTSQDSRQACSPYSSDVMKSVEKGDVLDSGLSSMKLKSGGDDDGLYEGLEEKDTRKQSSKTSPIRENSRKWIKFKFDAKNVEEGAGGHKSYKSKAVRPDDAELKFVWKATERIQKDEDRKRELFHLKLEESAGNLSMTSNQSLTSKESTSKSSFPRIKG